MHDHDTHVHDFHSIGNELPDTLLIEPMTPYDQSQSGERPGVMFSSVAIFLVIVIIASISTAIIMTKKESMAKTSATTTSTTGKTSTTATIKISPASTLSKTETPPSLPPLTTITTTETPPSITTTSTVPSTTKRKETQTTINTVWIQDGVTMAGGNYRGDRLDQLQHPQGIDVDDDGTLYIADQWNYRIVRWRLNAKRGELVAGDKGEGNRTDQLIRPTDVIIDRKNDALIICDQGNRRVVQWSRQNPTYQRTIISNIDCYHSAMDHTGALYVSDYVEDGVRRWQEGESSDGTIVAGGNGKGGDLNQLNAPTYLFVDEDHSVYVSDANNHRVMKWAKGADEGIVVAGGCGRGVNLTQLYSPRGLFVDHSGIVYVVDHKNNRVMRWLKGSGEASVVVGGNEQGDRQNRFTLPTGLSFDRQGNLYVADASNHRVQQFHIDN